MKLIVYKVRPVEVSLPAFDFLENKAAEKKKLCCYCPIFDTPGWPFWMSLALESYSDGLRCPSGAGTENRRLRGFQQRHKSASNIAHSAITAQKFSMNGHTTFPAHCKWPTDNIRHFNVKFCESHTLCTILFCNGYCAFC